ncbi:hypothetical protein FI667_g4338, partial [Globisporangium splendens]
MPPLWKCVLPILAAFNHRALHTEALQANAWSPCGLPTATDRVVAECTTAVVPLCYANACALPDDRTIQLSLKRISAAANTSIPRNVWVIPDRSDVVLPSDAAQLLQQIYRQVGGDASVYTLDQRGTGQSTRLTCNSSSTTADNATVSVDSTLAELHECAQSLNAEYVGDAAVFSITSAAYDLVTIISQLQSNAEVYIYGQGYGTLLVERLLHFGLPNVKGYVLDSSATTSGTTQDQFAYFSKADAVVGRIGDEFLALCENESCSTQVSGNRSISDALDNVLTRLDDDNATRSGSNCASSLLPLAASNFDSDDRQSYPLRRALAMMMLNATERAFIPAIIYRIQRCSQHDKVILQQLFTRLQARDAGSKRHTELVYDIQTFSELWEQPPPNSSTLVSRFTDSRLSTGRVYDQLARYCVFAGDTTSEACMEAASGTNSSWSGSTAFRYARDEYWNVAATIPAHASVLLLQGALDIQENAAALLGVLVGDAKALVTFAATSRNVISNTGTTWDKDGPSSSSSSTCGLAILRSYVLSGGDLGLLNTSCIETLPPISFEITEAMSLAVLNTTDAYDDIESSDSGNAGALLGSDPSNSRSSSASPSSSPSSPIASSSLERSRNRYRIALIVVSTVLALVLLLLVVLVYRLRDRTRLSEEERKLRRIRGDEPDDLELLRQLYFSSPEAWDSHWRGRASEERAASHHAQKAWSISNEEEEEEKKETHAYCEPPPSTNTSNDSNAAWGYRSNHLQL